MPSAANRVILHVDMDAFFASVEQLDHPQLRGKPVIVGSPPDRRGVVSTASYEARQFGVHSAMPSRTAYRLCPHGVFMPPRMARYEELSGQVMELIRSFSGVVEIVSIDEAFLDLTGVMARWPDAATLGRALKQGIREKTGLTGSVGVAPNKFLAKLASDLRKPDGLTVAPCDPEGIREFLRPLPVGRLWGVGKVTGEQLNHRGIRTIGQIQEMSEIALAEILDPAWAHHVYRLAFGRDDRPLVTEWEEKSISNETTYDEDCADSATHRQTLLELAEEVGRRLRASGKFARTVEIRVRFPDFRTISRQMPLRPAGAGDRELIQAALDLYRKEKITGALRLLGFGVSNLVDPAAEKQLQPWLFDEETITPDQRTAENRRLDQAVDRLRQQFGTNILRRGDWRK